MFHTVLLYRLQLQKSIAKLNIFQVRVSMESTLNTIYILLPRGFVACFNIFYCMHDKFLASALKIPGKQIDIFRSNSHELFVND